MNTEEDEFNRIERELAIRAEANKSAQPQQEPDIPFGDNYPGLQWDEVPQAFNDWWDSAYDPTGNSFEKDTPAYWAWAGWKAAKQPAQKVLTPWSKALEDEWAEPDEASPPAQQCTGCEGNPKYPNNPCALCGCKVKQPAQQKLVAWASDVLFDNETEIIPASDKGKLGTGNLTVALYIKGETT